jgi:hypothetical protein
LGRDALDLGPEPSTNAFALLRKIAVIQRCTIFERHPAPQTNPQTFRPNMETKDILRKGSELLPIAPRNVRSLCNRLRSVTPRRLLCPPRSYADTDATCT